MKHVFPGHCTSHMAEYLFTHPVRRTVLYYVRKFMPRRRKLSQDPTLWHQPTKRFCIQIQHRYRSKQHNHRGRWRPTQQNGKKMNRSSCTTSKRKAKAVVCCRMWTSMIVHPLEWVGSTNVQRRSSGTRITQRKTYPRKFHLTFSSWIK